MTKQPKFSQRDRAEDTAAPTPSFDDTAARPLALGMFTLVLALSLGTLAFGSDVVLFWLPILLGIGGGILGGWYLWRGILHRAPNAIYISAVFFLSGGNMLLVPFGFRNWLISLWLPLLGAQLLRLGLNRLWRSVPPDQP